MLLLLHLSRTGHLSDHEFVRAVDTLVRSQLPLGELCLRRNILTVEQLMEILATQKVEERPFGEIAVEGGFITQDELEELLLEQLESRISEIELLELMGLGDREWLENEMRLMRAPAFQQPYDFVPLEP